MTSYPKRLIEVDLPIKKISEPAPRRIKSFIWMRTRMTLIGWISMDISIRVDPCHPCNPCSTAFICGSFFADAPKINIRSFIKATFAPFAFSAVMSALYPAHTESKHIALPFERPDGNRGEHLYLKRKNYERLNNLYLFS